MAVVPGAPPISCPLEPPVGDAFSPRIHCPGQALSALMWSLYYPAPSGAPVIKHINMSFAIDAHPEQTYLDQYHPSVNLSRKTRSDAGETIAITFEPHLHCKVG